MIKEVHIQNFQSHKDTHINFHKGVNVIIGLTDSGKTSILRALRWVIWNKPSGARFRSNWGGDTKVTVTFDSGDVISRIKTDKENKYVLNGEIFKAFGTEPPDEVKKVLNINEINLQQQLDSSFLLSKSPGQVASHFNWIAKLDNIDTSLQYVNKEITRTNSLYKYKKNEIKEKKKSLKAYDNIPLLEEKLKRVELLEEKRDAVLHKRRLVQLSIEIINDTIKRIEALKKDEERLNMINTILTIVEDRRTLQNDKRTLNVLKDNVITLTNKIEEISKYQKASKILATILKLTEEETNLSVGLTKFQQVLSKLQSTKKFLAETAFKIKVMERTFKKEMPAVCPLCGNKIK